MDFIKAEAGKFTYKGKNIKLRGFSIGSWLCLEHFMVGLPSSESGIRNIFQKAYGKAPADLFFQTFQEKFVTEKDFKFLKDCGVNFIRVPFNYKLFIDDNRPDILKEYGFNMFDKLFKLCSMYQIFVMIDLHAAPGSQNPDWHSDNSTGTPLFWNYSLFRTQTIKLWGAIAERYYNEPYLMGYDLLNEPAMANWDVLNSFYRETIKEIRAFDKNHVIVLEGDNFSMDFSGLSCFEDNNLAIDFHYYPTVWNPNLLNAEIDKITRNEKIETGLKKNLEQTKKTGLPVLCGEFGYAAKDCGSEKLAMELLSDTIDLLEKYKLDWLLWCYKDIGYMAMLSPCKSSTWARLADSISFVWTQNAEKEQANAVLDLIASKYFPDISEQERFILQFRIRSCLYVLQGNHILLEHLLNINEVDVQKMAFDFSFDNCIVNNEIYKLIKNILLNKI